MDQMQRHETHGNGTMPMPHIEADAVLGFTASIKNLSSREYEGKTNNYLVAERRDPFGNKEAVFIKLDQTLSPSDFAKGERWHIPVLWFVGNGGRIFWRTTPEHPPTRIDG